MNTPRAIVAALLVSIMAYGCTPAGVKKNGISYRQPEKYNFRFAGWDSEINNPDNDRRSYYKVFIDKAEEGRTTTGLESQIKTFETTLSANRHLITVEKWVLDQKTSRYVKLNNIEQPKPNFIYFEVPEKKIVVIEMKTLKDGAVDFKVDFERK